MPKRDTIKRPAERLFPCGRERGAGLHTQWSNWFLSAWLAALPSGPQYKAPRRPTLPSLTSGSRPVVDHSAKHASLRFSPPSTPGTWPESQAPRLRNLWGLCIWTWVWRDLRRLRRGGSASPPSRRSGLCNIWHLRGARDRSGHKKRLFWFNQRDRLTGQRWKVCQRNENLIFKKSGMSSTTAATTWNVRTTRAKVIPAPTLGTATRTTQSSQVTCLQFSTSSSFVFSADGKGLIDVRSAADFTLDLSDSKCPVEDQICCKKPNFRWLSPSVERFSPVELWHRVERPEQQAPVEDKPEEKVVEEVAEFSKCGRSPKAHITLTGRAHFLLKTMSIIAYMPGLASDQAQIAEFPHMCVLFRTQKGDRDWNTVIQRESLIPKCHLNAICKDNGCTLVARVWLPKTRCWPWRTSSTSSRTWTILWVLFFHLFNKGWKHMKASQQIYSKFKKLPQSCSLSINSNWILLHFHTTLSPIYFWLSNNSVSSLSDNAQRSFLYFQTASLNNWNNSKSFFFNQLNCNTTGGPQSINQSNCNTTGGLPWHGEPVLDPLRGAQCQDWARDLQKPGVKSGGGHSQLYLNIWNFFKSVILSFPGHLKLQKVHFPFLLKWEIFLGLVSSLTLPSYLVMSLSVILSLDKRYIHPQSVFFNFT